MFNCNLSIQVTRHIQENPNQENRTNKTSYSLRILHDSKNPENGSSSSLHFEDILSFHFKQNSCFIGSGRTSWVYKIQGDEITLALKMVDVYKHPLRSLEELENEAKVLRWLTNELESKF